MSTPQTFLALQMRGYSTRFAHETHWLSRVVRIPAEEEIMDGETYLGETEEGILGECYPNASSPHGQPAPRVGDRAFYRHADCIDVPRSSEHTTETTFQQTDEITAVVAMTRIKDLNDQVLIEEGACVILETVLPKLTPKMAALAQKDPSHASVQMVLKLAAEHKSYWRAVAREIELAAHAARAYSESLD